VSQTSKLVLAVFLGFIVYITVKGQLTSWLAIVGLGSGASSQNTGTVATGSQVTSAPAVQSTVSSPSQITTGSSDSSLDLADVNSTVTGLD
jgi:hypothetical protein